MSMKDLSNTGNDLQAGTKTWGEPGRWILICKAWNEKEGWMRSTKAMLAGDGVLVQVSTQINNGEATPICAEALTFIPNTYITDTVPPEIDSIPIP